MYLAKLSIQGFRKLHNVDMEFRPGLNILVGPNNVGKTAVVDALRALLGTGDEGPLRIDESDLHVDAAGVKAVEITFRYVFRGLTENEEADFMSALVPMGTSSSAKAEFEARFVLRYAAADPGGRLKPKRMCGEHEETPITSDMLDQLRAVYLPPLRNPASGLRPSRSSQLARLVLRLSDEETRKDVVDALKQFDGELAAKPPFAETQKAISSRHEEMLGTVLKQALKVDLTPTDFMRVASRLSIAVESLDVEQNGLGYNNLIYMAVVLSELSLNPDAMYEALIVEEPEAHLHPQLQAVLLNYLQSKEHPSSGEKAVQVFATSHSPHFASIAKIDTVGCLHQGADGIKAFFPRNVSFSRTKKEKLQRYLDVTRAELFFARRIIFVEGAAELFMVPVLADLLRINLRRHSISVLSTEGLNFDAFLPLFGENALNVRVAVISDGDPPGSYPRLEDKPQRSATAVDIQARGNSFVQPFFALKTFEYDLALYPENRTVMLKALEDIHPNIAKDLREALGMVPEEDRPRKLFSGMFERGEGKTNVQKGAFGQALAHAVAAGGDPFVVPRYVVEALKFITED